jgi:hypothetical protein
MRRAGGDPLWEPVPISYRSRSGGQTAIAKDRGTSSRDLPLPRIRVLVLPVSGRPSNLVRLPFCNKPISTFSEAQRKYPPSLDNVIFILVSTRLPHRLDHVEHTLAPAVSEVECTTVPRLSAVFEYLRLLEGVQTQNVALGKVHHMQVVPYTGAVAVQHPVSLKPMPGNEELTV